jgi:alpha-galactosidase
VKFSRPRRTLPRDSEEKTVKIISAIALVLLVALSTQAATLRLDDLSMDNLRQDWGSPAAGKSVVGNTLTIGGVTFPHGVGTHATSTWPIDLGGNSQEFTASVGIDDEVRTVPASANAEIEFRVIGDHQTLFRSGPMHAGDPAKTIDVGLSGIHTLILQVDCLSPSIDYAHADWADAQIAYTGERPAPFAAPIEKAEILTPPPPATPRINGARIFGVRPDHPVLFTIAATGKRPMTFSAQGLPAGLSLDPDTGRITGSSAKEGESTVQITATNSFGSDQKTLRIVVGPKIALTPPLGWNSWNCFAGSVSDEKVRAAADAMVSSGLIQHGWTYINIDDTWEIRANRPADQRRSPDGHILTNSRFPDMKALVDYIHSKGLRAGLYSSPGPSTCGGYTASYQFEEQDAEQYAKWGFDYLKYDWCSYGSIADQIRKGPTPPSPTAVFWTPYLIMRDALLRQDRDIVFSFCQYGMGNVWEWGEQVGGNSWRTTGDIRDTWQSMTANGFSSAGHERFAGPGHWNDPDMLVVGKVGWGPSLHGTHLTPNEQYTHITLWCLLCSPLLIGCDMTQMDDFTKNLLTNDEVLAVSQDPLGQQAARIWRGNDAEVWAKDMEDGAKAVGLFNRGETAQTVTVQFSDLGLTGSHPVRDLWRQKDLGDFTGQFQCEVPRHGAVLIRIGNAR